MASVRCGEAQLVSYNTSSGLSYCSNGAAGALCVSLYGPGEYSAAPTSGACVKAAVAPTALPCPAGYLPSCGASCICIPSAAGAGSLLPGQNASLAPASNSISSLQASPGPPCATPLACFFTQSLPYALGALTALALAALLVLYLLRRCCCPRSSIPCCCLAWRCCCRRRLALLPRKRPGRGRRPGPATAPAAHWPHPHPQPWQQQRHRRLGFHARRAPQAPPAPPAAALHLVEPQQVVVQLTQSPMHVSRS